MKPTERVEAVSFDGDDTLWDFNQVMRHSLNIVLSDIRHHVPGAKSEQLTVDRMIEIRDEIADDLGEVKVGLEEIRRRAFVKTVDLVGGDAQGELPGRLNELYMHHRFADIELYPDVLLCLDALKDSFRLGLLSNGNGYPERCGLAGRFSFTAFAQDLGVAKPDPAFFLRVFRSSDLSPERVVHVGDSLSSDVAGANAAGCVSVWLNRDETENTGSTIPDFEIATLAELPALLHIRK